MFLRKLLGIVREDQFHDASQQNIEWVKRLWYFNRIYKVTPHYLTNSIKISHYFYNIVHLKGAIWPKLCWKWRWTPTNDHRARQCPWSIEWMRFQSPCHFLCLPLLLSPPPAQGNLCVSLEQVLLDGVDLIKPVSNVRLYVRTSVHKKFFCSFNEIWHVGRGRIFDICPSFCATWLWTWQKHQPRRVNRQLQLQLMTVRYYTAESWPVHTKLAG